MLELMAARKYLALGDYAESRIICYEGQGQSMDAGRSGRCLPVQGGQVKVVVLTSRTIGAIYLMKIISRIHHQIYDLKSPKCGLHSLARIWL